MITLRQKIGQMLIMGFNGAQIDEQHPMTDWLTQDGLGGVLLFDYDLPNERFGKNLLTQPQIKALTTQLHACKTVLPLWVALDYEGGVVDRLQHIPGCLTTMTPKQLAYLPAGARLEQMRLMAETLKALGFNLNFAPVIDLDLTNQAGIIGKLDRSFSSSPQTVIDVAREFVTVFAQHGITCCYKHFPGHGSATDDSHLGFVDVTKTYQANELDPYRVLLSEPTLPASLVMTAHVINRNLDESGLPATLSHPILNDLLRNEMGFAGVIISDDLQMRAISDHFSLEQALCLTINAGADMIIIGNQLGYITAPDVIDLIEHLVQTGAISVARIEQAYQRLAWLKGIVPIINL